MLITNRKSHLVPKSVTLNDLEQRNSVIILMSCYFTEFGRLGGGADYVKVVEERH